MTDFKDKNNPADYCILGDSDEYRLSKFERLTLIGGQELEKALGWLAKQLGAFTYQDRLGSLDVPGLLRLAEFYQQHREQFANGGFFRRLSSVPVVALAPVHGLKDGLIYDIKFPSAYQVVSSEFESEFSSYQENLTATARYWKHAEGPRPTIIAVHGWTMGDQRLNSLAFQPGFFYQLGLDIVLFELPYHGRRVPKNSEEPSLFPSSNVMRTNEAIGQAISDLRQLKLWLESNGVTQVGCIGMSLGAYICSVWSSLDSLSFCIPIVPMSSMSEMAWEALSRHVDFSEYKKQGLTRELVESLYEIHAPLKLNPMLKPDQILIIAGIGDRIVPARQPKMLWDHWRRPEIHWLKGGHQAHFQRAKAFDAIQCFLEKLKIIEKSSASFQP